MYFPYFHSFITFFILAISRSNFAQIQWSWTFFNSQDDELFKNVQDFRIWVKFDQVIVKKTLVGFFLFTLYIQFQSCQQNSIFYSAIKIPVFIHMILILPFFYSVVKVLRKYNFNLVNKTEFFTVPLKFLHSYIWF